MAPNAQGSNPSATGMGEAAVPPSADPGASLTAIDPAQMSLLDADPQMSLLLPIAAHPGEPGEPRSP
jgi:hypothetical protein